jgi:hypothetical protein
MDEDKFSEGVDEAFGVPWKKKPDHVDERGNKFWLEMSSTRYAAIIGLPIHVQVLWVEDLNGKHSRLIVDKGIPVYESQSLEAIGIRLDIMRKLMEDEQITKKSGL